MVSLFKNSSECCGCSACASCCPKNAIRMVSDECGYLYPEVQHSLCVDCGACLRVCPFSTEVSIDASFERKAWAVKNRSDGERVSSSSGAVFIELAKDVIARSGVVYGVRQDDDHAAVHDRAETLAEARLFQGSKYVQSNKSDTFKSVKSDLIAGRLVLFSGTPCEVAGLRQYLGRLSDNLITVDIICHGTPGSRYLEEHFDNLEKKYHSKIKKMTYRNKEYGWRNQEIWIQFENGSVYHCPIWEDEFYRLFTGNYLLRDSCYSCPFASLDRPGDITIGDFWNIGNAAPEFEDSLGVSSVFLNTLKGLDLFTGVLDRFDVRPVSVSDCLQRNLQAPSPKPSDYDQFRDDLTKRGFEYCKKKYGSMGMGERLRRLLSPAKSAIKMIVGR